MTHDFDLIELMFRLASILDSLGIIHPVRLAISLGIEVRVILELRPMIFLESIPIQILCLALRQTMPKNL